MTVARDFFSMTAPDDLLSGPARRKRGAGSVFLLARTPRMLRRVTGLLVVLTFGISSASSLAQLRVGAAKVDITPDAGKLPGGYTGILNHMFTRAIYATSGRESCLLINVDIGIINTTFYSKVAPEIAKASGVPQDRLILSAVHNHETPALFNSGLGGGARGKDPNSKLFTDRLEAALVEVAVEAKAAAQPAKMGYGTGLLYLNVNRDAIDAQTRLWKQGDNPEYPSDKTLAVLQFVKLNGEPIAVYMNYAMHANLLFLHGDISWDFPGEASHYMEKVYPGAVVLWSSGAAGDQNPLFQRPSNLVTEARITGEMTKSRDEDANGDEMQKAMMRLWSGTETKPPLKPSALEEEMSQSMVRSMGQIMAEEALDVMAKTRHFQTAAIIHGESATLTCPGRERTDHGREGYPGTYKDGPPVVYHLSELRIGDVALGAIDAEVYNMIGQRVKEESPFQHTIVITLANGQANSGYTPTDDAFGRNTFQVVGTRLKPGCAERGIVDTIDGMIEHEMLPGINP